MSNNEFSVLDAVNELSQDGNIDSLFNDKKQEEVVQPTPIETPLEEKKPEPAPTNPTGKEKKPWTPDNMEDLPEFSESKKAVYTKEEVIEGSKPKEIINQLEDDAVTSSTTAMTQMQRIEYNIQTAKNSVGIKHCQIPEGHPLYIPIMNAAEDDNIERAQAELVTIFNQLKQSYPETIIAMTDGSILPGQNTDYIPTAEKPEPEPIIEDPEFKGISVKDDEIKIIINKSQMKELSFTKEELDKIRTTRTIELNIVDEADLGFGTIQDAPTTGNNLNAMLSKYVPEVNSVSCVLPASNYRCEVTGLSYAEVLDLEHSEKMQNLDGLRRKWAIAFKHVKNPSIGDFKAYKWYIDPNTGTKRIVDIAEPVPIDISPVTIVSAYDDFLHKTSYLDIDFIIWKILCATAQDSEIVAITCGVVVGSRKIEDPENPGRLKEVPVRCGHKYEAVYSPEQLLEADTINDDVLIEMETTKGASAIASIQEHFSKAPVNARNAVKLPHSGFGVIYGHISAYDFVNEIYEVASAVENDGEDVEITPSRVIGNMMLPSIKAFIIPNKEVPGSSIRYSTTNDIVQVLQTLDEYDYNTVVTLADKVVNPYQFAYRIKDAVCPVCKIKSDVYIPNLEELLFILAHSLTSTQVDLKKR